MHISSDGRVYFNDNTKIVISAEGSVFQYIERKKRNNISTPMGTINGEHLVSTYQINSFPNDLQKKVMQQQAIATKSFISDVKTSLKNNFYKQIPMRKILIPEDVVNIAFALCKNQITTTGSVICIGHGENIS